MKVYLEEKDIGRKIFTYNDWQNTQQGLYVYGKDKIEVLSLADYTKQVRKEVCERLDKIIEKYLCKKGRYRESLDISSIIKQVMKENLDQIQGETK